MEDYPFEAMFLAARASRHLKDWTPRRWIKALRKSLGMTQAELASRAGLRQADVSRIETGREDPRYSALVGLAEALGCTLLVLPKVERKYDVERALGRDEGDAG